MLKHASNASGAASASAAAATSSSSVVIGSHAGNGQIRNGSTSIAQQQQPRSLRTQTSSLNGGQRIPVTPISPIIPNGNAIGYIGNNSHTYTNQHVTVNNHNQNNNNKLNATITSTITNNPLNSTAISTVNNGNYSNCRNLLATPTPLQPPLSTTLQQTLNKSKHGPGPREALTSLGLLCLVSLLLALLSLIFLLKISPNGREQSRNSNEDFIIVYDVTLALCALSLSLNLCCLLVCAIQFLFAVKLLRSPMFNGRDNKYLEKSSISRTCAVGGFFISIPIFLTGIILYTLNHFHSTPAIITSVLIGIGIIFCGCAMVHNVFVWQKEKTISYRSPVNLNISTITQQLQNLQQSQLQQSAAYSVGAITPPRQFLSTHNNNQNQNQYQQQSNNNNNTNINHYNTSNQCHHHVGHVGPSMTPVSPNHSHGSFNPLLTGALGSSFLMRPSTATPPTPKPQLGVGLPAAPSSLARAACIREDIVRSGATSPHGSVSPGQATGLDMSNITNASLHELSTLV